MGNYWRNEPVETRSRTLGQMSKDDPSDCRPVIALEKIGVSNEIQRQVVTLVLKPATDVLEKTRVVQTDCSIALS